MTTLSDHLLRLATVVRNIAAVTPAISIEQYNDVKRIISDLEAAPAIDRMPEPASGIVFPTPAPRSGWRYVRVSEDLAAQLRAAPSDPVRLQIQEEPGGTLMFTATRYEPGLDT